MTITFNLSRAAHFTYFALVNDLRIQLTCIVRGLPRIMLSIGKALCFLHSQLCVYRTEPFAHWRFLPTHVLYTKADKGTELSNPSSDFLVSGFPNINFLSCSQHTRSVHRDVLCTPLQLEISRNPLLQHAWFSSCQWLGTRARRPSKIKLRNVGRAKEFCSSFSC